MPASKFITRVEGEDYLDTVARAITSPLTTDTYQDSPATDYHRLSVSEFMSVAITENTPLIQRLSRREGARARLFEWFEQYLPPNPTVTFVGELADPAAGLARVPTRLSNMMGKLGVTFEMSEEADIIARANGLIAVGTDEMARQMAFKLTELARNTERAVLEAVYNDGSDTNPRAFRGLLGDYRNGNLNGWIGGITTDTTLDLGSTILDATNMEATLNKYLLQLFQLYAGPLPTTMYVPPRLLNVIQTAAKSRVTVFMSQDELAKKSALNFGGKVGIFYSDFGALDIIAHPLLTVGAATGGTAATSRILFLHEPGLSMIDYVGHGGVHIEPRPVSGPTTKRVISQIISLEARYLKSHGVIKNFYTPIT